MRWGEPGFSEVLLGLYFGMLTLLWGAMLAGISAWQRRHALPDGGRPALPLLSICIPARDEAHQIATCLKAALAQDHPNFEVVLVDDGSTDGTADVAWATVGADPRFRLVRGTTPPSGWAGKPWTCQRAAGDARGRHLLFVDADVELAPDAARRAASVLVTRQLGALSVFGTWRLESFWEEVAIPVVGWFIRGTVDLDAVNDPSRPEAFANGQFILVDRAAYDSIGGHGAVKGEVLEDVRLARSLKQHGHPLGLYAAPALFRVRLYRSLREIVAGYTKNFYEGMDRRPHLALGALLFLFIGAGLPYLLLAVGLILPGLLLTGVDTRWPWLVWNAVVCALPIVFRWRQERADGRSGGAAWTHPLGNLVLAWVLAASVFRVRTEWKGRAFHDGKAAS